MAAREDQAQPLIRYGFGGISGVLISQFLHGDLVH
jgi:hypothetical protein